MQKLRASRSSHLSVVPTPGRSVEDADVLRAFDEGDRAFGRLFYDHVGATIDRTLVRVLGNRGHDHDDLVQKTFEVLLRSLAEGKFQRVCSLRSFAAIVATRTALNAIRSRKVERAYFVKGLEVEAHTPGGERNMEDRETLERVRALLAKLNDGRAQALVLHDVLGYELTEIAAQLDITVAAAQSRLVRGRREFQGILAKEGLLPKERGSS